MGKFSAGNFHSKINSACWLLALKDSNRHTALFFYPLLIRFFRNASFLIPLLTAHHVSFDVALPAFFPVDMKVQMVSPVDAVALAAQPITNDADLVNFFTKQSLTQQPSLSIKCSKKWKYRKFDVNRLSMPISPESNSENHIS